jgi:hypothetical protein
MSSNQNRLTMGQKKAKDKPVSCSFSRYVTSSFLWLTHVKSNFLPTVTLAQDEMYSFITTGSKELKLKNDHEL